MGVIAGRVLCSSTLPTPFTASSNSASTHFQTGLQEFLSRCPCSTVTRVLSRGPKAAAQSVAFQKTTYSKHQAPFSLVTHQAPWVPGTVQTLEKQSRWAPNFQVPACWQCFLSPRDCWTRASRSRAFLHPELRYCLHHLSSPAPRQDKGLLSCTWKWERRCFIFDLFDIVSRSHRVNSQFIKSLTPWVLSLSPAASIDVYQKCHVLTTWESCSLFLETGIFSSQPPSTSSQCSQFYIQVLAQPSLLKEWVFSHIADCTCGNTAHVVV